MAFTSYNSMFVFLNQFCLVYPDFCEIYLRDFNTGFYGIFLQDLFMQYWCLKQVKFVAMTVAKEYSSRLSISN